MANYIWASREDEMIPLVGERGGRQTGRMHDDLSLELSRLATHLTVGGARAELLNLGVVELKKVIRPREEL